MPVKITSLRMTLILLSASPALLGNAPPNDIPTALQSYIVDGALKTGDFAWMRGAFDGATEQQKADTEAVDLWLTDCMVAAKLKAVDDLKALGVTEAKLVDVPAGPALCGSVNTYKAMAKQTQNWEEFLVDEKRAREIFSIYEFGAKIAHLHGAYERNWGTEESWDLLRATVMEQVYRIGTDWQTERDAPAVDAVLLPYLRAHMGNAAQIADRNNTAMLSQIVEDKGWPTIPMVGERASFNAWLLVQHADHDAAFQLKALRLMEPLAAKGEVSKRNYAYLYDRVMLKLSGKQRFGTQIGGCDGEEYALLPLEDGERLNEFRAEHELEPISQYLNGFKERRGPCQTK